MTALPFGPGILPIPSTTSHWQRTVAGDPLATAGKNAPLPATADVVIIGSGLSGAVTAHSLLSAPSRPTTVVVLEARAVCSGASGRNGGHCRPDAFRGYTQFSELHGSEQAKKILKSEAITLGKVAEFVENNKVECELKLRPTVDVALTNEFAEYNANALARAKAAGVDVSGVKTLTADQVSKLCSAPGAKAGWEWPAASINPLKLAYGVYRACFNLGGFSLYSYAPVTTVVASGDPAYPWTVVTSRGQINAAKVVHATNAYSHLLLPELQGLVTPFRAQAAKIARPLDLKLKPTMSLRRNLHLFYSVAPQPDDTVILSCARTWAGQTEREFEALWNNMNDGESTLAQAEDTATAVSKTIPAGEWVPELGKGLESFWSGIICWTPDAVPFVGPVPGKEGQYVIAGFNGHGMARIFHCAPCLADIMLGGEWDPTVPEVFKITPERLANLRARIQAEGDPTKNETAKLDKARL